MIMTRRLLASAVAVSALAAALTLRAAGQVPAEVRAKAAPVFAALAKIQSEPASAPGSRRLTFSEAEFNAYVACRLADESEAYVKSAEFKLLAKDRVEGHVAIDLGKAQTSGVLPIFLLPLGVAAIEAGAIPLSALYVEEYSAFTIK